MCLKEIIHPHMNDTKTAAKLRAQLVSHVAAVGFMAIRRHRRLVAIDIVGVPHWMRRATFVRFVAAMVVFVDHRIAERIGDRRDAVHGVVGVGCRVRKRVDGRGDAAETVVRRARHVAASVDSRDFAAQGVAADLQQDAAVGYVRDHHDRNHQLEIINLFLNFYFPTPTARGVCNHSLL